MFNSIKDRVTALAIQIMRPRWIVGTGTANAGELGIRVLGINLWYYKWPEPMPVDSKRYPYRIARKREFGEVVTNDMAGGSE